MDKSISLLTYIFLFIFGFLAGFVDSIAGGGGLISLPALLFAGLPPQVALGTNKLQSSFGSFTASVNYINNKKADIKKSVTGIIFVFIGASAGTSLVQIIESGLLQRIIPFLLLLVLLYMIFSPDIKDYDRHARINERLFYIVFGLAIGFYDGFFGPGTGNFWVVLFIALLGFNVVKATAYTKIMNFTSNFAALIFFAIGNNICYRTGLVMAAGQLIGARLGSNMVIRRGNRIIKPLFILIVTIIILNLFYKNFL